METAERADDDPEGYEIIVPEDLLPPRDRFPQDAARLGIDRYSGSDAAWIALAANLDPRNPMHRALALVLLAFFLFPIVTTLAFVLR